MVTAAPPGWTYCSSPRIGSPGVQTEYCIGFTVGAGLNNVRCTPYSTSCTAPATGPSKPLSQRRVEENQSVTAIVASLGVAGTSAPTAAPGTRRLATAATRAGASRSGAAAADTDAAAADTGAAAAGWFARTARDATAADRPDPAVRTAAADLGAAAPPGAAAALLETRAEEASAPADVSSACAVPAPAKASPTPTAPAPNHA